MSLKFGTDGVRGVAFEELTPQLVEALGRAAARVLGIDTPYVIGRDTRESGPALQEALTAGLTSEGATVVDLGVIPTPGVAAVAAMERCAGAVVSASHNPYADNGVKFFALGGIKLADDVEDEIEKRMAEIAGEKSPSGASGVSKVNNGAMAAYETMLIGSLGGRRLDGLSVVLDCANGAASHVAPRVFAATGAAVVVLNDQPDGRNINEGCGSTHPEALQAAVVAHGADIGLAFDGDADRVLAVDAAGQLVDGDHILAICAIDRHERDQLPGDTLVVTVMTNLGLRIAMEKHGIHVTETDVGDRYVLEALAKGGWVLGGEQSGHILFLDLATTGDGQLTGLQVMDVMARTGKTLAELASVMTRLPQVMINVRDVNCAALDDAEKVWAAVENESAALGDTGRVLLRRSGTEPIVRVMVEAPAESTANEVATRIAAVVESELAVE
ncbi:MAG: phosphoglucosamine mutase [Actinomycetota bacterium]